MVSFVHKLKIIMYLFVHFDKVCIVLFENLEYVLPTPKKSKIIYFQLIMSLNIYINFVKVY